MTSPFKIGKLMWHEKRRAGAGRSSFLPWLATVAQSVVHLIRNQKVTGSSPVSSSIFSCDSSIANQTVLATVKS